MHLAHGMKEERSVAAGWLRLALDLALAGFAFFAGFGQVPAEIFLGVALVASLGLQLAGSRVLRPTALDAPLALCCIAALGVLAAGAGALPFGGERFLPAALLVGAIGTAERAGVLLRIFVVAVALRGLLGMAGLSGFVGTQAWAFASTSAWTAIGAAFLARSLRGATAGWALALSVPVGLGGLFPFARTVWAAVVAGLGTMAIVGRRFRQALLLTLLLAGAAIVASFASETVRSSLTRALDAASWRPTAEAWAGALEVLHEPPPHAVAPAAKNALLSIWMRGGPLSLLSFVWLIASILAALRRGAKATGAPGARALIFGAAGVVGAFLAFCMGQDPLHEAAIVNVALLFVAAGLAASGEAADPSRAESLFDPEREESLEPSRMSAAVAGSALACAALGGLSGLSEVGVGEGRMALLALAGILLGFVPGAPRGLRGAACFAGVAILASRPFAAALVPGDASWWASPSALVSLAALVAGGAGMTWSTRRPGQVGTGPVAGVLAMAWASVFVALLHYGIFPLLGVAQDGPAPAYNFVVGACALGLLFLAWSGPLGYGRGPVERVGARLLHLPLAVTAVALFVLVVAGLT